MRKYILMLAVILLSSNIYLFCQDIIDPPKLNQLDTLSILQREPDRFVRGWTCGSPGNLLDSAMFINTYHGFDYKSDDYLEDTHIMVPPVKWDSYIVGGRNNNYIFNAHCLYLDPSLIVDTTQSFTPRANDNTGAAMGFLNGNWESGVRNWEKILKINLEIK